MSEALARLLDLATAWRRVKGDIRDKVFLRDPYRMSLIEFDLQTWLQARLDTIREGRYAPQSMFVCDVPKGRGLVRPGSYLSFIDRLVYAGCVGACLPAIHRALRWSQGRVDFSYQLAPDPNHAEWLKRRFTGWADFQSNSISSIRAGITHVVIADISAFYENVAIPLLLSDLRTIDAPILAVDQLGGCLNRWAQVEGRGIPQGQSASDILAKVYLNSIDLALRAAGYRHLRYVDDIRVFCQTEIEAKRLIIDLSRLLRKRGLTLQAVKSKIFTADQARAKFEEVTAAVRDTRVAFVNSLIRQTGLGDPYMSMPQADEILDETPDAAPLEVLKEAYRAHILEEGDNFNPTLFRFLISRLGKQRDSFALTTASYCWSPGQRKLR